MWHESRRLVADGRTFGSAATVVRTRIAGDVVGHPISVAADQTAVESSRYVQSTAAGQATPGNRAESDRSGACTPDVRPHWFDALARGISGVPHRSSTGTGDARAAMLADGVRTLAAPNPACARVGPNGALSADPSKAHSFWLTAHEANPTAAAAPRPEALPESSRPVLPVHWRPARQPEVQGFCADCSSAAWCREALSAAIGSRLFSASSRASSDRAPANPAPTPASSGWPGPGNVVNLSSWA